MGRYKTSNGVTLIKEYLIKAPFETIKMNGTTVAGKKIAM